MECYVLTMQNFGKVREGSNEGVKWMFQQFQAMKETSVDLNVNKMFQVCLGKVEVLKRSESEVTSIISGSIDNMVLNKTLDVLSAITRGGWNLLGENRILLHLNIFKHFCIQEGRCR